VSDLAFPSVLVKSFKPLGHSGQDRLQAVVGSKEAAIGYPKIIGFFIFFDSK